MHRMAISSSSVTRKPPSPELMSLLDWELKQAATVPYSEEPDLTPFQSQPSECAQSSIRVMSYFLHTSAMPAMSAMRPLMCETMAILAPLSMAFFSKSSTLITNCSVQLTYSGSHPACTMALGTAAKVKALVKILVGPGILLSLSFSFWRTAKTDRKMADPQELRATQYLCPVTSAKDLSTRETSSTVWSSLLAPLVSPPYLNIFPDSMTSRHRWMPSSGTGMGLLMGTASLGSAELTSKTGLGSRVSVSAFRLAGSAVLLSMPSLGTLATKEGDKRVYFFGPEKVKPKLLSRNLRLSLLNFVPQSLAMLAFTFVLVSSRRLSLSLSSSPS
mmetsp:Transcript_3672/g.9254  ORF Transcript_3672/g.9254 Transcript_3672/m.9254 type:complete len:331 (-) Transcript_3672:70-1062(-)